MERLRVSISQPCIRRPRRPSVRSSAPAAFNSFSSGSTSITRRNRAMAEDRAAVSSSSLLRGSATVPVFDETKPSSSSRVLGLGVGAYNGSADSGPGPGQP